MLSHGADKLAQREEEIGKGLVNAVTGEVDFHFSDWATYRDLTGKLAPNRRSETCCSEESLWR